MQEENKGTWTLVLVLLLVFAFGGTGGGLTSTAEFKADTLCALVITGERGNYTSDQLNVIDASDDKSVKYFVEVTSKGDWENIDDTQEPTKDLPWVQEAYRAAKKNKDFKLPWIIAANKSKGFSKYIDTEASIKQLIQPLGN